MLAKARRVTARELTAEREKNTLTALEHMALEHIGMHQDVNDAALERKRSVMRLWIIQTSIIPFRDDDGDDDHHPDASIIIQI